MNAGTPRAKLPYVNKKLSSPSEPSNTQVIVKALLAFLCLLLGVEIVVKFVHPNVSVAECQFYPKLETLGASMLPLFILIVLKKLTMRLLVIPTHSLTHQQHLDDIESRLCQDKLGTITFKFCYFLVIAPTGWWLFHGYTWYPRELGGSSVFQPEELWKNWPCVDKVEWADVYYLVQLAYHMHSFLSHLCSTRRKDFWEMLIHHIAAVTLITTSYCFNFVRIGILVFLVHDCSDVFTYGEKLAVMLRLSKYIIGSFYFLLMAVWIWTRLYVLPFIVLWNSIIGPIERVNWNTACCYIFFNLLLLLLVVLHIYWTLMLGQIAYTFYTRGKIRETLKLKVIRSKSKDY